MPQAIEKKVLFVDDDPDILEGIRREFHGRYEVHIATGAEQAIETINTHGHFPVVVTDMRMAGMDGVQLLTEINRFHPESVCIMLTGYADVDVAANAVNQGSIFRFLTKPCPPDVLTEALDSAYRHYRQAIELNSYTYSMTIRNGKIEHTKRSRGCLSVTGYDAGSFDIDPQLRMNMVLPEYRHDHEEFFRRIIQGREVGPFEFKIRKRNGTDIWVRDTVIPHLSDNGKVIRCDGLVEDITAQKANEIALRKANEELKEHDRLKSEFLSAVSHEMRTPLCIFKNVISNTLNGVFGKVNKKLADNLKMADAGIDRLARIISDCLDCYKIESGNMKIDKQSFCAQRLLAEVTDSLSTLAEKKNLNINSFMASEDLYIDADRDKLIQVLTNLIGNAIKFTPEKGKIEIYINDHINEVEIAVKDNGPGIDKQNLEKIFNRFVQIDRPANSPDAGTGLGLTIAKDLIEMQGGKIWADSIPGQGSCFSFLIPKTAQNPKTDTQNQQSCQKLQTSENS